MKPKLHYYINFLWNNIYEKESYFLGSISTKSENACNLWPRVYKKKQETKNGNIHWKCSRWGSHKCKTTAITRDNDLISCRNEHTHEAFPGRSDAKLFVQKMKQDTKIQQVPVNSIINSKRPAVCVRTKSRPISSSLSVGD